jgi:hypothetical protein
MYPSTLTASTLIILFSGSIEPYDLFLFLEPWFH